MFEWGGHGFVLCGVVQGEAGAESSSGSIARSHLFDDEGESGGDQSSVEEEAEEAARKPRGTVPSDFDDVEHVKGFAVNDVNGVNIMLMTALTGKPERERASAGVQVMIDKGYHTMYIYSDDRNPVSATHTSHFFSS